MKKKMLTALGLFLIMNRLGGQVGGDRTVAYDVKGDQLGMSLEDFQEKHHDPG